MKIRTFIFLIALIGYIHSNAQTIKSNTTGNITIHVADSSSAISSDTISLANHTQLDTLENESENTSPETYAVQVVDGEIYAKDVGRYKIYPTSNMYNFIKLDTMTGRLWRIQWSLDNDKEYETPINTRNRIPYDGTWINNRFEVYPTDNIYQFLLLDRINGRVWHFQWGFDLNKNWILEIQ